jgi:3-hydroxybutyryl-CoA dehydrogenase
MSNANGVARVVVVGTGQMAPGIAAAAAGTGAQVCVVGRNTERAQQAAARTRNTSVAPAALTAAAFKGADLVIEAVIEDRRIKLALLSSIETWIPAETIVVSNTSSLLIGDLAGSLNHPERFAGLHFLNPADLTSVVEVVAGPQTARSTLERLASFAVGMGKTPLVVCKDAPGFIWNRLQFALLRECLRLLDEGIADISAIDAAVADGLAPRWLAAGPFGTVDLGGLDTFRRAAQELFPALAASGEVSPSLVRRAENRADFYQWSDETREAVERLRAEQIVAHRSTAERRRRLTPPLSEWEG